MSAENFMNAAEDHMTKAQAKAAKGETEKAEEQYARAAADFLDAAEEYENSGDNLNAGKMYLRVAQAYLGKAKLNQGAKTAGDDTEAKNAFQKAIDNADKAKKTLTGTGAGGVNATGTASHLINDALTEKDRNNNGYKLTKP